MNKTIHADFAPQEPNITHIIEHYTTEGTLFVAGKRNSIKLFKLQNLTVNVKSFKVPNTLNKLVYRFLRKSKARRSYEYAIKLLSMGIGTPQPIAFYENQTALSLKDSYYVSEHLQAKYTFRDLVSDAELPNHEIILRQFTQFCFLLHEKGVEFTDHSPGNTLIGDNGNSTYSFYLVDLNRMNFHTSMNFDLRMENLKRLTPYKEMVAVMANEYAKLYTRKTEGDIFNLLWHKTSEFQRKFFRKKRIKSRLKFIKK